jgi:hypothetical protein
MMQMLYAGGVEVMTDEVRTADTDNPRGYFELEKVKKIKEESSWLPQARGKVFKMVSQLLYDLPRAERYKIIFMERDLDEMLLSQDKMLQRLGRPSAPRDQIRRSFLLHLEKLHAWLSGQPNMRVLRVSYNDLVERSENEAVRVRELLDFPVDVQKMAAAVDPSLYRNRTAPAGG